MKKIQLITLLALLVTVQAAAEWDSSDYLPIVREGVQWVNEKVIINQGDTTSYYYIYEFSGMDSTAHNMVGDINHACYYYTNGELDIDCDSLIAGLIDNGLVTCFRNNAYDKVYSEGNVLFRLAIYSDGGTKGLYSFSEKHNCIDYYLFCQEWDEIDDSPVLTEDNFTEVEPIEIEGISCSRYAYVKETGDTMCYVVEGIGFDSRNMGDLLTPFTREPDPAADYQEYCGLCHVIKDGQIIYKGMRYTPDNMTGIDEVVADQRPRHYDDNYYNLMGQPVGKTLPTTPGIYIHQGKKICVSRMP